MKRVSSVDRLYVDGTNRDATGKRIYNAGYCGNADWFLTIPRHTEDILGLPYINSSLGDRRRYRRHRRRRRHRRALPLGRHAASLLLLSNCLFQGNLILLPSVDASVELRI